MVIAGALFPLAQEVLQFWMPVYVAAGIALCACLGCAGVYISEPHHRFRVLLAAVGGGGFAAAVRFILP